MKSTNASFKKKKEMHGIKQKDYSWESGEQIEEKKKKSQETTHISIHFMVALWILSMLGAGDGGGESGKQDREGHHITEEKN